MVLHLCKRVWNRALTPLRNDRAPPRDPAGPVDYPLWIQQRLKHRRRHYALPPWGRPVIDVLTLAYNTDADVLRRTADSVLAQNYPRYRWIIWDNGSTRAETRQVLSQLQRHQKVHVHVSAENLGITRGHAAALPLCQGDYVALLDHDDRLYPDALRIAAHFILAHDHPALLYSDEDKLDAANRPFEPYFKPDWSPGLLQSTAYTCHLTLFRRDLADRLELFSDPRVEGSQDWDLALRFHDAGYKAVHIPEILYSWRVVPESTAGDFAAKPYIGAGQRACLEASLRRRGLENQFKVELNPLFGRLAGHWHLQRLDSSLPPIDLVTGPSQELGGLAASLNRALQSGSAPYLAHVPAGVEMDPPWLHEGIAYLELNPDAALVGGRILDADGRLVRGATVLGMGGVLGIPHRGSKEHAFGYCGLNLEPRNVSALWQVPWIGRREALAKFRFDEAVFPEVYPEVDLCLRLLKAGWRILHNPLMTGRTRQAEWARFEDVGEESRLIQERHRDRLGADPCYSPFLSLDPERAYQRVPEPNAVLRTTAKRWRGLLWGLL